MRRIVMTILAVAALFQATQAQFRTYTKNAEDSMACVQNISLYSEYFKQDNFKDAMLGWRKVASICPKSTESIWVNGIKILQELVDNEADETRKEQLIDTLFWAYDQRIEHFGEKEGYIRGRKGSDMMKYRGKETKAAYDEFVQAYELEKNGLEPGATIYYFKSAYDLYRKKELDESTLFEVYDRCGQVIEHNMSGNLATYYEKAQSNIDTWIGSVADCDKLIEIFKPKFNATPDDPALIAQITKLLDKQNCGDRDFYLEVAVAGYKLEPSAKAAFDIGKGYYSKEKYSDALNFFKEASNGEDASLSFDANKFAATTSLKLGNGPGAKSYAMKMLQINPKSGDAYILIGDAYVAGKGACGGNECTNRAVYWAAVDKYAMAKSVDPTVAETAQSRINSYSAQFPKKEDCFFHGVNEGTSFTFDCWIGETTTVRTRAN